MHQRFYFVEDVPESLSDLFVNLFRVFRPTLPNQNIGHCVELTSMWIFFL